MIYSNSRYADALIAKSHDARKDNYGLSIFRSFPSSTQSFFLYVWEEGDRVDKVAHKYLHNPEDWWKIMDINPEVIDPLFIQVGSVIRIPNATTDR